MKCFCQECDEESSFICLSCQRHMGACYKEEEYVNICFECEELLASGFTVPELRTEFGRLIAKTKHQLKLDELESIPKCRPPQKLRQGIRSLLSYGLLNDIL